MSPALQTAAYSRQLHFRFHPAAVDLWGQRARCHHGEILIRQITKTLELKQLSGCALKSKHICCRNQQLKEPKLLNKDRSPALLQGWHCVLAQLHLHYTAASGTIIVRDLGFGVEKGRRQSWNTSVRRLDGGEALDNKRWSVLSGVKDAAPA